MARFVINSAARPRFGGRSAVQVEAHQLGEAIDELDAQLPGARSQLLEPGGAIKTFVLLFVDGVDVRHEQGLKTPLQASSEILIVHAVAGG